MISPASRAFRFRFSSSTFLWNSFLIVFSSRNVVFAPAAHDQYSGSCFPGVADAMYLVMQNNKDYWSVVKQQLTILSHHVLQAARVLSR